MGAGMAETAAKGVGPARGPRRRVGHRAGLAAVLAGAALLLSACEGGPIGKTAGLQLAGVEAVSMINTQKTLGDHFISMTSGQDCSTLRAKQGGHYCVERYENEPVAEPLYCYRTLAAVTCYDRPSTNPRDRLVGMQRGGPLPTH